MKSFRNTLGCGGLVYRPIEFLNFQFANYSLASLFLSDLFLERSPLVLLAWKLRGRLD